MSLWPRSLAGQLIAGLLVVMGTAAGISFFTFIDERRLAVHQANQFQSLSRIASVVRLVEITPMDMRDEIVRKAGGPLLRFTRTRDSMVDEKHDGLRAERIRRRLMRRLGDADRSIQVGAMDAREGFWRWGMWGHWRHRDRDERHRDRDERHRDRDERHRDQDESHREQGERHREHGENGAHHGGGMIIAIRLVDGEWLNARTRLPRAAPGWAVASLTAMAATAVALMLMIVLLVRRVTRPLAGLAAAAERAGRGEAFTPLPEEGPSDVRDTITAFNRMQDRQQRFIADRTRMLAAISHDIRTPITSLRIRAEFIDDAELQARILATLDEMQAMTEATLTFVREDTTEEAFCETDLEALAESVCADVADLGKAAHFTPPPGEGTSGERVIAHCRPYALRRALRNIVDNALAYAGSANVHIERRESGIAIVIEDEGPGIAEADMQRVFEPFFRLEDSRNRETGGMGLGMAIARTILRAHGGDVHIANRPQGGLRVTLQLPPEAGV